MKDIFILILLSFALASISLCCRVNRDLPQANVTHFVLIGIDSTGMRYLNGKYIYRWYDFDNKVTYVVYSNSISRYSKGQSIFGLIRK
jgi:hypothetical protein